MEERKRQNPLPRFIDECVVRGIWFLLVIFLAIACTSDRGKMPSAEQGVVVRIDSTAIMGEELRDFVVGIPLGLRPQGRADEVREEYLRSLIAKYLLDMEARERGLDTVRAVREAVKKRWQQRLVKIYREEFLAAAVELSDAEVGQYVQKNELSRRRRLARILVDEKEEVEEVVRQLDAGGSFGELVRKYSTDERSVEREGVLGYVSLSQARRLKVPDEVFRLLPEGKHSGALPRGKGYQVVCFLGDSLVSKEILNPKAKAALWKERLAELEKQQVDSLAWELEWEMEPDGLRLLLAKVAAQPRLRRRHLSSGEAEQLLFTYRGGEVTLGEYLDALWEKPMRALAGRGLQDSVEVSQRGAAVVMPQAMLFEAAQRVGIGKRPAAKDWREQVRLEYMIKELRRAEAEGKAKVSDAEVRGFYEEQADAFRQPEAFYIVEVLVETEMEAEELLAELQVGETLSSLAQQRSIRPGMREEAGMLYLHGDDRLTRPRLYKAVQEASLGGIVGPVPVEGGYSVFKLLHREGGQVRPFSEVERRVRAVVRQRKKEQLFEALVARLKEKYRERIVVYAEELTDALPDSLLERLEKEKRAK